MIHQEFEMLYEDCIGDNSIPFTDSHKSYIQFTKDFSLDHKHIKRGKSKEEIYHIRHINAVHSKLKK